MAGRLLFRYFCWFESGKERLGQPALGIEGVRIDLEDV